MAKETWRSVVGWPAYEVSDLGRVKRVLRSRGAWHAPYLLRPGVASHGYLTVALSQDGITQTRTVHSLVAEAFIGPYPQGKEIDHKNGNRTDARLSNLRYVTSLVNNRAAGKRHKYAAHRRKLSHEDVKEVRRLANSGMPQTAIATNFGVSKSLVCMIVKKQRRIAA